MSDETLRALEREARGKKDRNTNETLKRAQERAGKIPIGITKIKEEADSYVITDLPHGNSFVDIAWSRAVIPMTGITTQSELIKTVSGGMLSRLGSLFTRRKQWELPDTKIIYSTICAVNLLVQDPDHAAAAGKLMKFLGGQLGRIITGTTVEYSTGPNDTIRHRYGRPNEERITLPLKSDNGEVNLMRSNETTLLAFFGTTNARDVQREFHQFRGGQITPALTLNTPNISDREQNPTFALCPVVLFYNYRPSHGPVSITILATKVRGGGRPIEVEGSTTPVRYL